MATAAGDQGAAKVAMAEAALAVARGAVDRAEVMVAGAGEVSTEAAQAANQEAVSEPAEATVAVVGAVFAVEKAAVNSGEVMMGGGGNGVGGGSTGPDRVADERAAAEFFPGRFVKCRSCAVTFTIASASRAVTIELARVVFIVPGCKKQRRCP